jgi:hypothetical protein
VGRQRPLSPLTQVVLQRTGSAGGSALLRRGVGRQRPLSPLTQVVLQRTGSAGGSALLRRGVGRQRPQSPLKGSNTAHHAAFN